MYRIVFSVVAVVTAFAGAVVLGAAVGMGQDVALRSPEAWLPLSGALAGWLVALLSPRNRIAWLLLGIAVSSVLFGGSAVLVLGSQDLPALVVGTAGWLSTWVFLPAYWGSFLVLPLLYPDGRLPSPRWRPVLVAATTVIVVESVLLAFGTPETVQSAGPNPLHWGVVTRVFDAVEPAVYASWLLLAVLGVVALIHRIVIADPDERLSLAVFTGTVAIGLAALMIADTGLVLGLLLPVVVAGTVAHRLNVQLQQQLALARAQAEDLRESRARIAHASDDARRAIERDLHDGAQQGLLALSVGLGRLADQVEPPLRQEVQSLKRLSHGTLVDLRRLAAGTYPSALRELGVAAAVREAVGPEVRVTDTLEHRPSEQTEAALYFSTLEVVTNARKHAHASTIEARLDRAADGAYRFRVTDDGVGMSTTDGGTGLDGIADRLGAHGGTLSVESQPGSGTTVTGTAYEEPR